LLHGDHADSFNIHAFGDHQYLTGLHNQLQAGDAHATETSLLQERGAPGGMHLTTISKIGSTPLLGKNGRVLGSFFEDSDAKYCVLGGIGPTDTKAPRGEQTTEVLDTIQRTLTDAGMHFRDVVRTWFYNDDILAWYPEFNQARTAFFQEHGITRMPASTGIGVANFSGAALVTNAIAVQPKTGAVTVRRVKSPLQHEASAYGSSFSRAMEIADRKGRVLYISGTASILPNGETTHLGDVAGQIEKTMEVVKAILEHNKMNFTDTTRAIAYFRHQEHIPLWNQYCRNHRMPLLPVILTRCDVCRDNLLFEIELDAAKKISSVSNGA
jgi:enamine deaminase RidA (YjgF/YER057c/UK114 family)